MGLLTALHHVTSYRYNRPIVLGMQTIRLRPAPHTRAHIQSYSLKITPAEHFINWQQDPFGNYLAKVVFPKKVTEFSVEVDLVSEMRVFNPLDFFLEEYAKDFPFEYEPFLKEELAPYLAIKENGAALRSYLSAVDRAPRSIIDFLVSLNQSLNQSLKYIVRMDPGIQTCDQTLTNASGSCRDMAWLLCQILRHMGFATRFASGYLIQLVADVKSLDGPSGTEHDFTDLHAWTEVYLPGAGWVGLDPTSGLFTGEGHIPLCCTPSPSSAAPISGTLELCETIFAHDMTITRMDEKPRVTRPFTDEQWNVIDALGAKIDQDLTKRDVRLTMGGEPTFISDKDRKGNEWHFEALSDHKKKLGQDLFLRLRETFAHGGLVQYTQGKWYPGELLPRWAMNCTWRKDNAAIWENTQLLADPQKNYGHTLETAKQFITHLAKLLGIAENYIVPAHEDTVYYLWKEQKLPQFGDMLSADPYEKAERERLQKLFDQHLSEPVAYALPLHFSVRRKNWISNPWEFRTAQMVLLTGDSPAGLRLPLASLPHVEETKDELCPERSVLDQEALLPPREAFAEFFAWRKAIDCSKDKNGLIKSALCAEIRGGTLHIFVPPVAYIEHFLELIAAIESVASALDIPIIIEGYAPPSDVRISSFSVTPDPGVLEINVQPARDWPELKHIAFTVYEQARLSGLSAEKFMIDGRAVGTGGGNHIVMGAAHPADSPFLRRPDMLRSLIAFWQNHPSLSYLFSGLYIGPTSQSPRIDEARHDALYELEIAFQQIPDKGDVPPWLVDRVLRNLLVDLTGNTHRAEFCIDKLYSPDSERGRLGLLEMRGFEMMPHPQMNLLQALLLRACIACFWQHPYTQRLKRFGTALHDKFMLPYYIQEDLGEVLAHLKMGGYDFSPSWFEPFFTFRFPEYGSVQLGDISLELRMALEPWPVMGEEMNAGAVSRSVDSSVERMQISMRGFDSARYILTCNGRAVPMHSAKEQGVYVGGVRYKAWQPVSGLHPNIPAQTPLIVDIIDKENARSIGGCRYHVAHPGGRNYDTLPVNANEAEGRRLARFEPLGHTAGHVVIPAEEKNIEFPHTLDLRTHFSTHKPG